MVEKVQFTLDDGKIVETSMHPVIVSASRATDIPAFYADWFFYRLRKGYSAWINPFNNKKMYVSYQDTRFIVFWSKNPKPLLEHFDELDERGIGCYIQYTLNDYGESIQKHTPRLMPYPSQEGTLEKNVPPVEERIDTFKRIVDRLGFGHVVWRFDPLVLTNGEPPLVLNTDALIDKIERIGDQLKGYTEKLVFSFADIACYRKVKHNLKESGINYVEWDEERMRKFASRLVELNKCWGYTLATCGESIDLPGVEHNHCIDHDLIIRLAHRDRALMEYLGVVKVPVQKDIFGNMEITYPGLTATPLKRGQEGVILLDDGMVAIQRKKMPDKGQRAACGCMVSKDIGQYNTCPHQCEYCYANASKELATANWKRHKESPYSETIIPEEGR